MRDERDIAAIWASLKKAHDEGRPHNAKQFLDNGINELSMLSPPCFLWRLLSSSATENVACDLFHIGPEGLGNIFCEYGLTMLSESARETLQVRWNDKSVWGPAAGSNVPPFALLKLAAMSGSDKEMVGRHGDILLYPLFLPDANEADMYKHFREGVRKELACRLLGMNFEEEVGMQPDEWKDVLERAPWKRFYREYVCSLADLFRALAPVYQTRARLEEDGLIDQLCKKHIAGSRLVFGPAFIYNDKTGKYKGNYHRVRHLAPQALSKYT
jgi:hypothetical protein